MYNEVDRAHSTYGEEENTFCVVVGRPTLKGQLGKR
jgi:hypothetical protein